MVETTSRRIKAAVPRTVRRADRRTPVIHRMPPLGETGDGSVRVLSPNKMYSFDNSIVSWTGPSSRSQIKRVAKRAMDVAISTVLLLFLLPVFLLIALAVKLGSKGPVLFRQARNGMRGSAFRILKFRTMHVLEDGPMVTQACRNDPRVTEVGAFLRRSSLDELPQLLNVFFGEMSLVGPRPHARAHDELYSKLIENYEERWNVKPGITGWAQVHGLRGETRTVDEMKLRIDMDIWYAQNSSFLLDCKILFLTIGEVLKQRNAY
jgi:exopolysaccharide biosynthesis polyprenyl glycosylphosphotransferase